MARKPNLEEEALEDAGSVDTGKIIVDQDLLDICPATVLKLFQKARTPAQRADLLYKLDNEELRELRKVFQEMESFVSKLKAWFVQELVKVEGQTGVAGKIGRVELKKKSMNGVNDWDAFWEYVRKKKAYDLLQKRINDKAINARLEEGIEVPGTYIFEKTAVSLTGVKK